jgi:hypothetical protein
MSHRHLQSEVGMSNINRTFEERESKQQRAAHRRAKSQTTKRTGAEQRQRHLKGIARVLREKR